MKTEKLNTGLE